MADEVKRYDVEVRGCMGYERADELVEAERGEYVRSEDYDRVARELAAWKRAADECNFVDSSTASRWLYERVEELMKENGDG